MIIRYATFADLPSIVEIYNSTIPSRMVTADTEPVTVDERREWFEKHSPEKRPIWVVESEGKIAGWMAFHSFYGRKAYDATAEISIYLHESARGKGIGSKLLERAEVLAKPLGIKTFLGYIFAHNEPSLKLFRKAGFTDWGKLPDIATLDGIERSLLILGKRIQ